MKITRLRDWVNLGVAAGVFAGTFAFYSFTGPRDIAWLEGADFQRRVALVEMGEGPWHQPLYVLFSQPFLLISGQSRPRQASLASAGFGAGACLFVYLLLKFLLQVAPQFIARRVALIGALSLAVAHTFWLRAITPGPETLDALLLAATLYCLFRFASEGKAPFLYAGMFVLGLSLANNLAILLLLPVFALYVRVVKPPLVGEIGPVRARGLLVFLAGSAVALALLVRGWWAAGFEIPAEQWSWLTFWRERMLLAWEGPLKQSLLRFGTALLYNFPPWTAAFALAGLYQLSRRQKFVFWLLFPLFLLHSAMAVTLTLRDPFSAYLPSWVLLSIAAGYGWWKGLADGGWRDYIAAVLLTLSPLAVYRFAPATVYRLREELRVTAFLAAPFEVPLDPLVHLLNPDRRGSADAREYARAALEALPSSARVVAASAGGERTQAPLRYLKEVEGVRPQVRFERLPADRETLERWAGETSEPLVLAGLHPPQPDVERLLDRYHFLPAGYLFRVVPRGEVPGRTFSDLPGPVTLAGEWYGFERPQGYAVSFSIHEAAGGSLSGKAVLNEGGARPLEGVFTRLNPIGDSVGAQITYADRLHIHLNASLAGNRLEGTWLVYEAPELKGTFSVWKQEATVGSGAGTEVRPDAGLNRNGR